MKKMSIKMRVTLWYSVVMILIMTLAFGFIYIVSDSVIFSETELGLKDAVGEFAGDIEFKDGYYDLDDDLEFTDDGVSFSIYDSSGNQIAGTIPHNFPGTLTLKTHEDQRVTANGKEWLVHDAALQYGDDEVLWVRGVISLNAAHALSRGILSGVMIIGPVIVFAAAFIGYIITQKAFRPVERIRAAAQNISSGNDLSERLPLGKSKDEIYYLGETFNEMLDRLERSFENEKQFTSDASHELRTPTSVIISQCEYGLSLEYNEEELKECLRVIWKQSNKMSRLIAQLLQLSRADRPREQLEWERVDLSMMAEMVAEELEEKAEKANIEIRLNIEEGIFVKGDQTLLMRMLMNVMENGIKYGRQGGYLKVALCRQQNQAICEVEDNGIGLAKDQLPKVWNRFYRVDKSRTSVEEGNSGLGLSMVSWIVSMHQGSVSVKSAPGKGSIFTIQLPGYK